MGFILCALFNKEADFTCGFRAFVKAIGDKPHSHYFFKEFYIGIEVVFGHYSNSNYFILPTNPVKQCGVGLVYKQDMELMEELNQANAQCCSSSRVITYEGWDGVHHGYVNSKRSRDECDDECHDEFDDD
uniref:Uncharacterized protein n=1 Tax=Quercus lobata TaxID=97700 RepID=A0A7N2M792_QUELO